MSIRIRAVRVWRGKASLIHGNPSRIEWERTPNSVVDFGTVTVDTEHPQREEWRLTTGLLTSANFDDGPWELEFVYASSAEPANLTHEWERWLDESSPPDLSADTTQAGAGTFEFFRLNEQQGNLRGVFVSVPVRAENDYQVSEFWVGEFSLTTPRIGEDASSRWLVYKVHDFWTRYSDSDSIKRVLRDYLVSRGFPDEEVSFFRTPER